MNNIIHLQLRLAGIFLASVFLLSAAYAQNVTVNLNTTYQTIRGFGGMNHRAWTGYDLSDSDRNLAFGNGEGQIGMTVMRIWVSDNESQWAQELPSAKDVISRGGIVYASPWNPPAALRTDSVLVRWGTSYNTHKISPSNYSAYVNHLNKFAKYMKDNGAPLYAISIQNEPDWCDSWTCWGADAVYNFTKNYAAGLRLHGTKVITAEAFAYAKTMYNQILNDASALQNIDILGTHFYGSVASTADSYFQYPLADQKLSATQERWMTEHYTESKGDADMWRGFIVTGDQDQQAAYDTVRALDVAYEIHRALAIGNFNQYTWWYIRRDYGMIKNSGANAGKVSKRGYCMAQYSKFVRPGAVRVEATQNPAANVYASAYTKADSVVIVVVNRNRASQSTLNFSVPAGASITSWKKYTTSETKNVKNDGSITASNGSFSVSFDQESVTTLVGVKPSSSSSSSSVPASSSSAISQGPYSSAASIPGTIQAENYDVGGEGVAYHDEETDNRGGTTYRNDGVDIVSVTDGYAVGYTIAGEWLEYTVNVERTGVYTAEALVASGNDASSFRLFMDDEAITDTIKIPKGESWDTYSSVSAVTSNLSAGTHVLKLLITGSYVNIDRLQFTEGVNGLVSKTPALQTNGLQEYHLYNFKGAFLGMVRANDMASLKVQMRKAGLKAGVYLIRSANKSFLLDFQRVN